MASVGGTQNSSRAAEQIAELLTLCVDEGWDVAEVLVSAVVMASDAVGGFEQLLAQRPGSWESDHVRQMARAGGAV